MKIKLGYLDVVPAWRQDTEGEVFLQMDVFHVNGDCVQSEGMSVVQVQELIGELQQAVQVALGGPDSDAATDWMAGKKATDWGAS